jgi:hypothetical protein
MRKAPIFLIKQEMGGNKKSWVKLGFGGRVSSNVQHRLARSDFATDEHSMR